MIAFESAAFSLLRREYSSSGLIVLTQSEDFRYHRGSLDI